MSARPETCRDCRRRRVCEWILVARDGWVETQPTCAPCQSIRRTDANTAARRDTPSYLRERGAW